MIADHKSDGRSLLVPGLAMWLVLLAAMMGNGTLRVLVLQRFMLMQVFVPLGEMHPKPKSHQRPGNDQCRRDRLLQQRQRQDRPEAASRQVVWALLTSAEFRFNH